MATHVLHLVEYLYLGGIERILEQFAKNSSSKIHHVFFTYETPELRGIGKSIQDQGFTVFAVKKRKGRDYNLIGKLIEVVRIYKIDCIHTHDFGPIEYAVMLKIISPRLRLFHTQHTIHHFLNKTKYRLFFQLASFFFNRIVAVSKFVEVSIRETCPFAKTNHLVTVPNGVNTNQFLPQHQEKENILKLVAISRISYEKNIDYLLNTCRLLREASIPFEFHHAGSAKNPSEQDKILKYLSENNLLKQVFFYGYQEDTREILNKGNIFVSASLREGHPVSVLEAMALEKFCICSGIPPHRETSDGAIVLFNHLQEDALFKILIEISSKITSFDFINKKAREVIKNRFSIERMVNAYAELYEKN